MFLLVKTTNILDGVSRLHNCVLSVGVLFYVCLITVKWSNDNSESEVAAQSTVERRHCPHTSTQELHAVQHTRNFHHTCTQLRSVHPLWSGCLQYVISSDSNSSDMEWQMDPISEHFRAWLGIMVSGGRSMFQTGTRPGDRESSRGCEYS